MVSVIQKDCLLKIILTIVSQNLQRSTLCRWYKEYEVKNWIV